MPFSLALSALGGHDVAVADYTDSPLMPGTRVRVRQDVTYGPGPWPAEPTGTLEPIGPEPFTEIETQFGHDRMYFVRFDEPQHDVDGDGPYESSQVLGKYLEALPSQRP